VWLLALAAAATGFKFVFINSPYGRILPPSATVEDAKREGRWLADVEVKFQFHKDQDMQVDLGWVEVADVESIGWFGFGRKKEVRRRDLLPSARNVAMDQQTLTYSLKIEVSPTIAD
jgi:hypothetical protein